MSDIQALAVTPGEFSDIALSQIIAAMALSDNAIAQLASEIRQLRRKKLAIESVASRNIQEALIDSRSWDLYLALMGEGLIDSKGLLDLVRLREKFKPRREVVA